MFVFDLVYMLHMFNSHKNITNLQEVKHVGKTKNKKTMVGSLWEY